MVFRWEELEEWTKVNDAEVLSAVVLAILVAFYLMFIRPAQSEQRKRRQDIRDLRPGDDVLTTSGFIASVKEIETPEEGPVMLHLEIAPGVRVRALASAVQQRVRPGRLEELSRSAKVAGVGSGERGPASAGRRRKGAA